MLFQPLWEILYANKFMKNCSIPLALRKVQIKTKMRYHYILPEMLILIRLTILSVGEVSNLNSQMLLMRL